MIGVSVSALNTLLSLAPEHRGEIIRASERCRRLIEGPLTRLAPPPTRRSRSAWEGLAQVPEVQQTLSWLYCQTIGSSGANVERDRRTGSVALTLQRFADFPICPDGLREQLRGGSQPAPLVRYLRSITAELEQRVRGERHYQLASLTGRRENVMELEDGTRVNLDAGRVWVFDDMSTNWPFWFELPAEAGGKLAERWEAGVGRQGLYGMDVVSQAWLGCELLGRVRDAYTSAIILRYLRRLMSIYGKPDTIIFERSVWAANNISGFDLSGDEVEETESGERRAEMAEDQRTELREGLRALGVRVIYVFSPHGPGKAVLESAFNYLQRVTPTFMERGEGIGIGRYAGEFERAGRQLRRVKYGVGHPRELGFLHIDRAADVTWAAMQWINAKVREQGASGERLRAALAARPLPGLVAEDLHVFLPELRERRTIRGGHVTVQVDGQEFDFIHPEWFARLGDGYHVHIRFDPVEPSLGAAIYNAESAANNFHGFRASQFICLAVLHEAAPLISLRSRNGEEGLELVKRYRAYHRIAFRALDLPRQKTVKVSEQANAEGGLHRVEVGTQPAPQAGAGKRPINRPDRTYTAEDLVPWSRREIEQESESCKHNNT